MISLIQIMGIDNFLTFCGFDSQEKLSITSKSTISLNN